MKVNEIPDCPHCQTAMKPERINAARYVCVCCSREFAIPKR